MTTSTKNTKTTKTTEQTAEQTTKTAEKIIQSVDGRRLFSKNLKRNVYQVRAVSKDMKSLPVVFEVEPIGTENATRACQRLHPDFFVMADLGVCRTTEQRLYVFEDDFNRLAKTREELVLREGFEKYRGNDKPIQTVNGVTYMCRGGKVTEVKAYVISLKGDKAPETETFFVSGGKDPTKAYSRPDYKLLAIIEQKSTNTAKKYLPLDMFLTLGMTRDRVLALAKGKIEESDTDTEETETTEEQKEVIENA